MAKRERQRSFYLIPRRVLNALPVDAVLDMLRYDHCTVESNAPAGFYLFAADADLNAPRFDRWKSFGVASENIRRIAEWDVNEFSRSVEGQEMLQRCGGQ